MHSSWKKFISRKVAKAQSWAKFNIPIFPLRLAALREKSNDTGARERQLLEYFRWLAESLAEQIPDSLLEGRKEEILVYESWIPFVASCENPEMGMLLAAWNTPKKSHPLWILDCPGTLPPHLPFATSSFIMERKIETTDSTEYTDSKRVMNSGADTLWMNAKNPVSYSLSVSIRVNPWFHLPFSSLRRPAPAGN